MRFSVLYEKINDGSLPSSFYYAHIPSLNLTTHGEGLEGAKNSAIDLINLWIEEKQLNNEPIHIESESFFSSIEI